MYLTAYSTPARSWRASHAHPHMKRPGTAQLGAKTKRVYSSLWFPSCLLMSLLTTTCIALFHGQCSRRGGITYVAV